jgi:phosphate starvation-inducible membrane PsiE
MSKVNAEGTARDVRSRLERIAERIGNDLIRLFHLVGLFVIGGTVIWGAIHTYAEVVQKGYSSLEDILLLFIYLEFGAMVGIYFNTKRLPVEFLLFVAITVVTRQLVAVEHLSDIRVVVLAGVVFVLAAAVFLLLYGSRLLKRGGDKTPRITDVSE